MTKTRTYVGPDIGTTSVKVVVTEYIDSQMNIIGVGSARSGGINRDIIVGIDRAVQAMQRVVRQAKERVGIQVKGISVGLPVNMLEVENRQGVIAVSGDSKEVADGDVRNMASAALVHSIPSGRQTMSVLPQDFTVDGLEGIKNPRRVVGVRLEMYGLLFTGPEAIAHNMRKCVENAGLIVNEMVITPLALTGSILSGGKRDFGTIVVDMDGGRAITAVIRDKQLRFTNLDQKGDELVTKDISIVLDMSFNNAEALKVNYGDACPRRTSPDEEFPVDVIGQSEPMKVNEHYLSEVIPTRMEQIFNRTKGALDQIEALELPDDIVLTGGTASPPGVVSLAQEIFSVNVKLYVPNHMGLKNPVFTNVISIVDYSADLSEVYQLAKIAVTGGTSATRQMVVEQETTNTYESYETPEETIYDEPGPEESGENVKNKVEGFFINIFD